LWPAPVYYGAGLTGNYEICSMKDEGELRCGSRKRRDLI
jgi:hypothetical protein